MKSAKSVKLGIGRDRINGEVEVILLKKLTHIFLRPGNHNLFTYNVLLDCKNV